METSRCEQTQPSTLDGKRAWRIFHRDLKPANIMLGDFGEVYVLDWGVAKLVAEWATAAPLTLPGAEPTGPLSQREVVGTVGYMPPEQLLGLGELQDARTDVYALGAILYEILTLRRLHQGDSFEKLAESTRNTVASRPAESGAEVPPELDALCARACARERSERVGSARELSDGVERYLDGDRDLARRRELSQGRAAAARAALTSVAIPGKSDGEAAAARADAVREVTAALALDPDNAEARQLLVRLIVEPPARMPPEVRSEIADASFRSLQQFVRIGSYGMASWMLTLPIVAAIGIRAWMPILLTTVLCLSALGCALWVRRRRELSVMSLLFLSSTVFATVASVTSILGPFVLVPQFLSVATLWLASQCRSLREGVAVIALGGLAAALPFLVEQLGLFPPAYGMLEGNLILYSRTLVLAKDSLIPLIFYASVTCVVAPAFLLVRLRQRLAAAEGQLFLHAWHLRQILPADAPPLRPRDEALPR